MKRFFAILIICLIFVPSMTLAQDNSAGNRVTGIVESVMREYRDDRGFPQAEMRVNGYDGKTYEVDTGISANMGLHFALRPGNRVTLEILTNEDGSQSVYFNDAVRTRGIWWVALAFAIAIIAIGLTRGVRALIGLAVTVAVLFGYVLPAIISGSNAVTVSVIASLVILAFNMHLTHGWKRETWTAFASTAAGLVLAWAFGKWFISLTFLSGLVSEESAMLYLEHINVSVDMSGILLAGIIIGTTGALDDIAIAQGEVVAELRKANPSLSPKELFVRAMRVGRHHIASIANPLVLAYAGAALPTLLLFWAIQSVSVLDFLNTEAIAEEIVRTLAGTTALVLTVPISTWFAVSLDKRG